SRERFKVETLMRYASYIERARKQLDARSEHESKSLLGIDFRAVPSLSNEGAEALERARPANLGAASRLRGVRDSDVTALLVHLASQARAEGLSPQAGVAAQSPAPTFVGAPVRT